MKFILETYDMSKKFSTKYGLLLAAGLGMVAPAAFSAVTPWVGTADYSLLNGQPAGTNMTGSFDTYAFGAGDGSIVNADPTQSVGSTFTGFYQTYVTAHQLNGFAITPPAGFNNLGTGLGYELTMQSMFTGKYTANLNGNLIFDITGGTSKLYFGPTANYNFKTDSGFTDGTVLLAGNIDNTGSGALLKSGYGFSQLNISGIFGTTALGVYNPNTIEGGLSQFTIDLLHN